MVFAVDLNDVVRDYTSNFVRYYHDLYDREFDLNTVNVWTNQLSAVFPFASEMAYQRFVYEQNPYELFAKAETTSRNLSTYFQKWIRETIPNLDSKEKIDVIIVSPFEYGASIQATLIFLSKLGCLAREYYFPEDSVTIWDKCDVLITANPDLIRCKPEGKVSVQIKAEYNKDISGDYIYSSFEKFIKDENVLKEIVENHQKSSV